MERELPVWRSYDRIILHFPAGRRGFLSRFPELEDKLVEMQNIVSPEAVIGTGRSGRRFRRDGGGPVPVHRGRFSHAKGMDRAVRLAARLVAMGMEKLRWYLIGYGDEMSLRREIAACGHAGTRGHSG